MQMLRGCRNCVKSYFYACGTTSRSKVIARLNCLLHPALSDLAQFVPKSRRRLLHNSRGLAFRDTSIGFGSRFASRSTNENLCHRSESQRHKVSGHASTFFGASKCPGLTRQLLFNYFSISHFTEMSARDLHEL